MTVQCDENDVVSENALQFLPVAELEGGGQSKELSFVRSPAGEHLLYKKYLQDALTAESERRLCALARWRRMLPVDDRVELDSRTAWVRQVVRSRDTVTGVLIQPAGSAFWMKDLGGNPVPLASYELVTQPDEAMERDSDYFDIPQTLARLGHLLETLSFLHARGVAVGDLTLANVLVSKLAAGPETFLVDCDAVLLDGNWTLERAEADLMRPSTGPWPGALDRRTDLYKFGLMVGACLEKDGARMAVPPGIAGYMAADHMVMLRQFVDVDAPTPSINYVRSVARMWRRCVGADGGEYLWTPDDLQKQVWSGQRSIAGGRSAVESPLAAVREPAPIHLDARQVRRAASESTRSAVSPPTHARPRSTAPQQQQRADLPHGLSTTAAALLFLTLVVAAIIAFVVFQK